MFFVANLFPKTSYEQTRTTLLPPARNDCFHSSPINQKHTFWRQAKSRRLPVLCWRRNPSCLCSGYEDDPWNIGNSFCLRVVSCGFPTKNRSTILRNTNSVSAVEIPTTNNIIITIIRLNFSISSQILVVVQEDAGVDWRSTLVAVVPGPHRQPKHEPFVQPS